MVHIPFKLYSRFNPDLFVKNGFAQDKVFNGYNKRQMDFKYNRKDAQKWLDLDMIDFVAVAQVGNKLVFILKTETFTHTIMRMVIRNLGAKLIKVLDFNDGKSAYHTNILWAEWNKYIKDKVEDKISFGYDWVDVQLGNNCGCGCQDSDQECNNSEPSSDEPSND